MKKLIIILLVANAGAFLFALGPTSTDDSNVEQVDITGDNATYISHTGCPGVIGLEDLTIQSVDLTAGSSYSLDVTFGTCNASYWCAGEVWIDFDQSGTFDPNESLGTSDGYPGTPPWDAPVTFLFTVPDTASTGTTVMRVMQQEDALGFPPLDPTASYDYGSMMDFGIVVYPCAPVVTITESPGQIALSWASVDQAESYKIFTSETAYGSFTQIDHISGLLWFDTELDENKFYQVKACTDPVRP